MRSIVHTLLQSTVCVALAASIAQAIVIRDDRPDSTYRAMAADFPMVCSVAHGMGTLIDSRWVITAGHVAESLPRHAGEVILGNRHVPVSLVVIHPDFGSPDEHRDLALLKLSRPVYEIRPARLYTQADELGMRVIFVGDGQTGNGITGPHQGERVCRAAQNTVDSVSPGWLRFTFDEPPAGDDLEGISGPGDSGGPALIRRGDSTYVIGVSAYNDGDPECLYGTHEFYSRISDQMDWIRDVMSGEYTGELRPHALSMRSDDEGHQTMSREEIKRVTLPITENARLATVLKALMRAFADTSASEFLALMSPRLLADHANSKEPLINMFDFLIKVCTRRGAIEGFHPLPKEGVIIPETRFPMCPIVFHLGDGMPGYFGIAIDDQGKIDHLSLFVQEAICKDGMRCTDLHPLDELAEP